MPGCQSSHSVRGCVTKPSVTSPKKSRQTGADKSEAEAYEVALQYACPWPTMCPNQPLGNRERCPLGTIVLVGDSYHMGGLHEEQRMGPGDLPAFICPEAKGTLHSVKNQHIPGRHPQEGSRDVKKRGKCTKLRIKTEPHSTGIR